MWSHLQPICSQMQWNWITIFLDVFQELYFIEFRIILHPPRTFLESILSKQCKSLRVIPDSPLSLISNPWVNHFSSPFAMDTETLASDYNTDNGIGLDLLV